MNYKIDKFTPIGSQNQPVSLDQVPLSTVGSTAPPPPYSAQAYNASLDNPQRSKEEIFRDIINRYEINSYFSSKLQCLFSFKIVFIFDDSGSMGTVLSDSPLNVGLFKATRWDELKEFSKVATEVANIFNHNGSDVHFLNRPPARNVRSPDDLVPYFVERPNGFTPLTRVINEVLYENHAAALNEKKLLIVIVTDGEPTTENGSPDIKSFKKCLQSRSSNVYTTIVSCTDEDNTMEYLNKWDRQLPRLDVVDDYRNERAEILKVQGSHFRFSLGDYVVKCMIGSIDPEIDALDEKQTAVLFSSLQLYLSIYFNRDLICDYTIKN